jgi:hypothetical protein
VKIRIESLKPYTRYALQVRGYGGTETEWSPTYVFTTNRDRLAPPTVPGIAVEGAEYNGTTWHWYGEDIAISWNAYSVDDQTTWDHDYYVVKFVSNTGTTRIFRTKDRKFVLSYAMNVQSFGGNGCANFSKISVWGVDKTGNPSYENIPWNDGPHAVDGTVSSFGYASIINPAPSQLQSVTVDFTTPNLVFGWTQPSGAINQDVRTIKIVLQSTGTLQTKTFYTSASTSGWTLSFDENKSYFNSGNGSPEFTYSVSVIDVFAQEGTAVTGTATNQPPQTQVSGLKSIGVEGGISIDFDDIKSAAHKDHWVTEIYERIKDDVADTDSADGVVTGYTLLTSIAGDTYDYIPATSPFAYRWIRARYVDVFGQTGPVTKASTTLPSTYPVRMIKPVTITASAPAPPTDLAIYDNFTGSLGVNGEIRLEWTPPTDETLNNFQVDYELVTALTASTSSWAAFNVPADRTYITNVASTVVSFAGDHNFTVGDRVSIVNYGSVQHRTVTNTTANSITVNSALTGTLQTNTYDRSLPASAVVRSGVSMAMRPGTKYNFAIRSASSTHTSQRSSIVTFTTAGNALIAQKPLEIGTYYLPLPITSYSINSNVATVNVSVNPTTNGFTAPAITAGLYVSILDSATNINGRWKVLSATSSAISFTVTTANDAGGSTTGTATAGKFAVGAKVNAVNDGIYMDESNLWLADTGAFRAGTGYNTASWAGVEWNPSSSLFKVSGDITARSGRFAGNVYLSGYGSTLTAGLSYQIDSTRTLAANSSTVTIPVITDASIPAPPLSRPNHKAQIYCDVAGLTTDGTVLNVSSYNSGSKTITVDKTGQSALNGTYANGTIFLNNQVSIGSGGIIGTDIDGELRFMLTSGTSGLNRIAGWDITKDSIKSKSDVATINRAGMSSSTSTDSFWAGGDAGSAVWRVNTDGNMYLGNISFKGTSAPARIYSSSDAFESGDFYLSSDGKFSIKDLFSIDATAATTKVKIGTASSSNKFVFEASGTPKFYQTSGTAAWGDSNTKIYMDYTGQFSVSDFFKLSPTSAEFKIGSIGSVFINQAYTTAAGVAIAPSSSYLTPSNLNSFVISRDSGQAPNAYSAGIYFPSNYSSRTSITADPEGYPLFIQAYRNNQSIFSLYADNTFDDALFTAHQSLLLTANNYDAKLISSNREAHLYGSTRVLVHSPNGNANIDGNAITLQHAYNNSITMTRDSGDLNVVLSGIPAGSGTSLCVNGSSIMRLGSSSRRFKRDIEYIDGSKLAEDALMLQPVTFRYNQTGSFDEDNEKYLSGYIAEDIDSLGLDYLVSYDADGLPASVYYDKIAINAIELSKQQKQEIDDLKQTVLQLMQRIETLEEGN